MIKRRKIWKQIGIVVTVCFALFCPFTVYAGDINAAEQTVIDYYNRTFYYDGKNYVATEAAKASVYQKMISDDVDLTESQARSAIRQASKNIKQGIEQGYLVEVTADNEDTGGGSGTETGSDEKPGSGTETGSDEKPGSGTETGSDEKPGSETETGSEEKPGSGTETGSDEKPGSGTETGSDEQMKSLPKPTKKIDVEQLLTEAKQAGEKYAVVQTDESQTVEFQTDSASTVTVAQYLDGKLTAVSEDGYVLFAGGLPLKNTGYYIGSMKVVLVVSGTVLLLALTAAAVWILRNRSIMKENHKAG